MREPKPLLLDNIGQLVTLNTGWDDSKGPRRGAAMRELGIVTDAAVLCVDGKIAACGKRADVRRAALALLCFLPLIRYPSILGVTNYRRSP